MTESFEAYRERALGYLGARDPMRVLAATPRRLRRLTAGRRRSVLARSPGPRKWSTIEIVAHLADAELAFGWRIRNMVATPGVSLQWWDEHLWSERCMYARIPIATSLAAFAALRSGNLVLLRSLARRSFDAAFGIHDKRGRQTLADFVVMEAAHDLNHLLQIRALLAG
jgi:hypothetical protein